MKSKNDLASAYARKAGREAIFNDKSTYQAVKEAYLAGWHAAHRAAKAKGKKP